MSVFRIIFILLVSAVHISLHAQTEIIVPFTGSATATVCNQLIYDYGGSSEGLTKAKADGSITIYPSTPGTMIALSIADLDIDYYSDYLYIYNGENTSAPLLATLQGAYNSSKAAYAGEYYGTNVKGAITIRLKTTYVYAEADGMILRARCTPIGEQNNLVQNQKRVINSCNTTIYDNGGSRGDYLNNSKDTLLILPDAPDKAVQLRFEYVAINNWDGLDQLYFLGGLNTGSSTLFTISGYTTAGNSGTTRNPDGSASFVFESDASYVGKGFRTVVTCTNKTTTPLTENIVPISGTASMKTCSAKISDNGDKYNYFPNSNGTLTINPLQAGTKVKAVFSQFSLGAGDYLNFYDGANTSAPLIAKYTNTSTANSINATNLSGALTVQFVSNASDEAAGFAFDVSCMTPVPVASIVLTPATINIDHYAKTQLTAEVLPANSTNKKLIWTSSDPTIATVTATGLVTGLLPGNVTITAQSEEYSTVKGTSVITVQPIPVTGIMISPSPANVQIGLTAKLTANFIPSNASHQQVTWSSSDPSIISVNASGTVTGVSFGTVTITATSDEGGFTATSLVTVIPLSVRDITVNPGTATIASDGTIQLSVSFIPSNAGNKQVTWSTTNAGIVVVNSTGFVEAVKSGSAYIFATSLDGNHKSSCRITVSPAKVTGITMAETAQTFINNTVQLNAVLQPSNATNKQITWTSSDQTIATVSSAGLVTGVALGTAVITAKSTDGNFTATTTVSVLPIPVTGITIVENVLQIILLNTVQAHALIAPANAANQQITWTSSNESIATVNATGLITGLSIGTAVITAKTNDGNFTATTNVTVLPIPVKGISIIENTLQINMLNTVQVNAEIVPANATNQKITWTSSNESVATVNATGLVTGISVGSAIIKAITFDGNFMAEATITVNQAATTGIASGLSNNNIMIYPNPSEGSFNVKFPVPIETIEVTNSIGQKEVFNGSDFITTNLKGLLVIKIYTEQGSYFSKLVIK